MAKLRKNKIETLEKVRDMFVLGCNLGQRYSDLVRINPENFRNQRIVQQKTGNKCFVPINTTLMKAFDKNTITMPYVGDQ